jgi:hypothetical protein
MFCSLGVLYLVDIILALKPSATREKVLLKLYVYHS